LLIMVIYFMPAFIPTMLPTSIIRLLSVCFPLSGIPLGIGIGQMLTERALSRNMSLIMDVCESGVHYNIGNIPEITGIIPGGRFD